MPPVASLLFVLVAFIAAALSTAPAWAQGYPNKQINLIVGFTAGGSTDIVARLVAEEMRKTFGQSVVVENKSGAAGNIAANDSWKPGWMLAS